MHENLAEREENEIWVKITRKEKQKNFKWEWNVAKTLCKLDYKNKLSNPPTLFFCSIETVLNIDF